jgi:hypothetical protein
MDIIIRAYSQHQGKILFAPQFLSQSLSLKMSYGGAAQLLIYKTA